MPNNQNQNNLLAGDTTSTFDFGNTFRNQGLDLAGIGTSALRFASLFIPSLRPLLRSPFVLDTEARNLGREQSAAIAQVLPNLGQIPTTGSQFSFRLPTGQNQNVSLPAIGERAIGERFATFEELQNLSNDQRNVIANFQMSLGNVRAGLAEADTILRDAGLQSNVQLQRGLRDVAALRQNTLNFMAAGFRDVRNKLDEIRKGNTDVLNRLDEDITNRLAVNNQAITQRNNAEFTAAQRALDSVSPLSPEERAALRSFYDARAASDVALSSGTLHEQAVEFRANVDKELTTSLTGATAALGGAAVGLLGRGVDAFTAAEQIAGGLRQTHINAVKDLSIARKELATFSATFTDTSSRTLFDMVSQMTRPVLVFSDILSGLFDRAFDIQAFNNNVDQLTFANNLAAIDPQFRAAFAVNATDTQVREAESQRSLQSSASRSELTGEIISSIGSLFTGGGAAGLGALGTLFSPASGSSSGGSSSGGSSSGGSSSGGSSSGGSSSEG